MSAKSAPVAEHGPARSAWAPLLGCIAGLIAATFFGGFFLASCTEAPEADGSVLVNDEAELLSDSDHSAISTIKFPKGTAVVVRTVGSIPINKIGTFATDLMPEEMQWQRLRPRGFLRTHVRQDPAWARGVYVLVSRDPELVQIRFGQDIRLAAYQEGLAAGDWYREQQDFDSTDVGRQLESTLLDLAKRMESIAEPRWPLSWGRSMSSWVSSDVEDFLAPSDGLYSTQVLANYIRIAALFGGTGSALGFVTFNLVSLVSFWLVGKKIVVDTLLLPRIEKGFARFFLVAISNLGLLGVLLTGFAALALLSHGRIEDELALEALGLSFLSKAGFESTMFSTSGGLWLAMPGALIALLGDIGGAVQEADVARRHGEVHAGIPVKWLGWACALFLLPLSIGLPAFVILVWTTGTTLKGVAAGV